MKRSEPEQSLNRLLRLWKLVASVKQRKYRSLYPVLSFNVPVRGVSAFLVTLECLPSAVAARTLNARHVIVIQPNVKC